MLRRTALALSLPLAFVLGCGAAPQAAAAGAAAPPEKPASSASDAPAPGSGLVTAPPPPPPPAADSGAAQKRDDASSGGQAAPGRAVATNAPISTTITQADILALVNRNTDVFYRCYSIGAGGMKNYRAKVKIKATVSPVGAVNAVEILDSTAKNPKVDACVVDAFKKLVFARAPGSGATVFTFPLSFDGMEQVQ